MLETIEKWGNRLPHPTALFIWLCVLMLPLSWFLAQLNIQNTHPLSGELIEVNNLLSRYGLQRILTETVSNFMNFAPLGTVLVAMLGIGLAERSGLLGVLLSQLVKRTPPQLLTAVVVLTGVLSSLAADTGYVVLIPLAAAVFHNAGRPALAGIAAAFAGVSGGFSANLFVGPFDVILAGLTNEASKLISAEHQIAPTANYYFIVASTVLITVLGTWVTSRFVEPRLSINHAIEKQSHQPLDQRQKQGLVAVLLFTLVFFALIALGLAGEHGVLRTEDGEILKGPLMQGIVVAISLYFALAGLLYFQFGPPHKVGHPAIQAMEQTFHTMSSYLVLMFFAAQFISYFNWTNLGAISAISGAYWLKSLSAPPLVLLTLFILVSATINLLMGSATAKWAIMAPVFIPMLLLLGIDPASTQMAFRIGDSCTNIITPLMPYFALVVSVVEQYEKDSGMGTLAAMMLPYSLTFLLGWTILFMLWLGFGLPLGPELFLSH